MPQTTVSPLDGISVLTTRVGALALAPCAGYLFGGPRAPSSRPGSRRCVAKFDGYAGQR